MTAVTYDFACTAYDGVLAFLFCVVEDIKVKTFFGVFLSL